MAEGGSRLTVFPRFVVLAAALVLFSQGILFAENENSPDERVPSIESDPTEVFAEAGDDARIRSIVKEYLAEQEAKNNAAAALTPVEASPAANDPGSDLSMHASWRNGVEIETKDKNFRVHFGGRTQFDGSWFRVDPAVRSDPSLGDPIRDGVDFRRARLRADGTMYEVIDWAVEYDFMNSTKIGGSPSILPSPTDLWFTITHLPVVGNFRAGNQKEPVGFERLVSSRYLPFMERSFNQDVFYQGFNNGFVPGLQFYDTMLDERATWWVGFFKPTNNSFAFNTGGGEYSASGRLTALPWSVDDGRRLLHVGASVRTSGLDEGLLRFRTRGPERSGVNAIWPLYADSPSMNGSGQQMVNVELASVLGPLNLQAEYTFSFVQSAFLTGGPNVGTVFYQGGYVEALYFLTGEHRPYDRKAAVFGRVIPRENFFKPGECGSLCGRGAWQVGARYNYLDLNNKGINGGRLNDITVGLNWFLNPNMKIQWNYSVTERDAALAGHDGLVQGFGMRFAHDF